MKRLINDYSLRFYVRGMYTNNAAKRGGEVFIPIYKKDITPFKLRVKTAINFSGKVFDLTAEKYPINYN